jgi:hypothetical protein
MKRALPLIKLLLLLFLFVQFGCTEKISGVLEDEHSPRLHQQVISDFVFSILNPDGTE